MSMNCWATASCHIRPHGSAAARASVTARPFFERHGFRVIAPQTVAKRGQSLLNFRMDKPLTLPERPLAL